MDSFRKQHFDAQSAFVRFIFTCLGLMLNKNWGAGSLWFGLTSVKSLKFESGSVSE